VLAQVCDGLAYAHGKGVLHRDIKPSNIRVLREGGRLRAKVMDFGVARLEGSELTSTGTVLGTFGYMAPEYIRNGAAEPGSDLFAVGVMLYEGLSGRKPFAGDTTATILYRVVHEDPQPLDPRDLQGVSPKVGALLARALAKHPRNRFADAEVMARALRSARDPAWAGLEGDEATVFLSRPSTPGPRRHRAWALALGLLVAAGLGAWAFRSRVGQVALHSRAAIASGPQLQAPAPSARAPQAPAPRPESEPMAPPVRPGPAAPRHRLEAPAPQAQPPDQPPPPGAAEPSTAEGDTGPTGRLNEAARDLEADPGASLAACDEVLRDHPSNPRAHALRLVALYQLGRDGALRHELQADQNLDLPRGAFLRFEAFRKMLQSERRAPRLPPEDRRALMSLVPRWSGGRPGQGDSGDLEGVAE
jgi:serine/threonine-protein kinase